MRSEYTKAGAKHNNFILQPTQEEEMYFMYKNVLVFVECTCRAAYL